MTVTALREQIQRLEDRKKRLEEDKKRLEDREERLEGDKTQLVDRKEQLNDILIRQCVQLTQNLETCRPEGEGDMKCDKHGY